MKNFKDECRIKVEGVNIDKIYKTLMKNNITMSNIDRPDYKVLYFNVKTKEKKKTLKLIGNGNYKISVDNYFGISKIINVLKKRFAFVIIFVLFFSCLFINSKLVNDIKIYGNNLISSEDIVEVLNNAGIKKMSLMSSVDLGKCEDLLLNNFNTIGLVSVAKVGNNIIVNIKEKTLNNLTDETNGKVIAQYSGQIVSIEVVQGTAVVKDGDSVKQGDVLVENYYLDGDKKVECKANAKIKQKIWFSHSETFYNEENVKERTGNKIVNYEVKFGDFIIKKSENQINFNEYDVVTSENYYFKNNFIPLKIVKNIYFETINKMVQNNFEDYKQQLIEICYNKAQEKLPTGLTATKSFDTINNTDYGYVVSAYYECEIYI